MVGAINWLQSRTQYQAAYGFSRCASKLAAPKIKDLADVDKLVRRIRVDKATLKFWPLLGIAHRLVGFPDASYNNNPDKSTQRGLAIFIANVRLEGEVDAWGSMVDYESTKITNRAFDHRE